LVKEFVEKASVVVAKPFDATLTFDWPRVRVGGLAKEELLIEGVSAMCPEKFWKLVRFSV
jgi:hypothetical protein